MTAQGLTTGVLMSMMTPVAMGNTKRAVVLGQNVGLASDRRRANKTKESSLIHRLKVQAWIAGQLDHIDLVWGSVSAAVYAFFQH